MPGYTFEDIGACNCGCVAYPCSLPNSNLAYTDVFYFGGGGVSPFSGTMTEGPSCVWNSGCIGGVDIFNIATSGGVTTYTWNICVGGCPPSGLIVVTCTYKTDGSGTCTAGFSMVLDSYNCTTQTLVFTLTNLGTPTSYHVMTITP